MSEIRDWNNERERIRNNLDATFYDMKTLLFDVADEEEFHHLFLGIETMLDIFVNAKIQRWKLEGELVLCKQENLRLRTSLVELSDKI